MQIPEAWAYIVRSSEEMDVLESSESLSTSDLIASDLAQAQFEVQDLIEKHTSWSSLCNLKLKGSREWQQCQDVLSSESSDIKQKNSDVALLQARLDKLASQKLSAVQVEHDATDAADVLTDHLDRANIQLDQLVEKRDRWRALCDHSMQQRSVGQQRAFLQNAVPDKQCLEVVKNIEHDMASARKNIASYPKALASLPK